MMDENYENNTGGSGTYSQDSERNSTYGNYEYSSDYDDFKNHEYQFKRGSGANQDDDGPKKPKKGKKKFIVGILVAVIVGICVGAGVWGANYSGGSSSASSQSAAISGGNSNKAKNDNATVAATSDSDTASNTDSDSDSSTEASTSDGLLNVSTDDKVVTTDVTQVVDEVMPSIVSVYNNYTESANYFGQNYEQEVTSEGSGIIVAKTDSELLIVTNNHVVENAEKLSVQFIDETNADASIKGTDSTNDLAVIAVPLDSIDSDTLSQISVATLGSSDNLKVGEPAIAIGNALGIGQSVTTGVISATDRELTTDETTGETSTFIQTDAAINEGNSGGALVNIRGEVIGINSNKIGGDTVEGMGFAIPISKAEPIIEELMQQETKTKVDEENQGTIGISGISVTSDVASAYNMPQGVYVAQIISGGGAESSDLQKGDIITGVNGTTVKSMDELQDQLQYYEAGTTVTLTVERNSGNNEYEETTIDVTLGTKESLEQAQQDENGQDGSDQYQESGDGSDGTQSEDQSFSFPFGF